MCSEIARFAIVQLRLLAFSDRKMKPQHPDFSHEHDLFRHRVENIINLRHQLCRLGSVIDWSVFGEHFGALYSPDKGCPGKPTRLMVGLLMLKQIYKLSDEAVVARWMENPYWQHFCGEEHFCHDRMVDPSSLTRFRKRIGESGCELIFQ